MAKAIAIHSILILSEWSIVLLLGFVLAYHTRRAKLPRGGAAACYLLAIALVSIEIHFPLENIVFRYASPAEAYRTKYPLHEAATVVINDTNEAAFVFGTTGRNEAHEIQLENSDRGWKFVSTKNQFSTMSTRGTVYRESTPYEIIIDVNAINSEWNLISIRIFDFQTLSARDTPPKAAEEDAIQEAHTIQSSFGASFAEVPYPHDDYTTRYVVFVKGFPDDFSITVDGKSFLLNSSSANHFVPYGYIVFYALLCLVVHLIAVKCVKKKSKKQV